MFRSVIMGCVLTGLVMASPSSRAQDKEDSSDALKKDAEAFQGKWERVITTETSALGKAKRAVKEFKDDTETITWYDEKGGIIRSHRVTFKLSESGNVRVYTFSGMELLDAEGRVKGAKSKGSNATIYRIEKDKLVEAGGFIQGDTFRSSTPYFAEWKKVVEQK